MALPRLITTGSPEGSPARVFLEKLFHTLTARLEHKPISRSRQPAVTQWLRERWAGFVREYPGPWLLCEGCAVKSLKGPVSHGHILLAWTTAFHPAPRYGLPAGRITPLGFYREYDVYVSHPDGEHPELIARYGKDFDASVWHLADQRYYPPADHVNAHKEALRRANLANALAGTPWAQPARRGSLGVPLKPLHGIFAGTDHESGLP